MGLFIETAAENPQFFVSWILVISFSICVHEWAHAAAAHACGDDTAAEAGHLTLNPLVQMGPMSLFFLVLIGIAWGAVPVDPSRLRARWHEAWVAFAGPLSNLVLCVVFGLVAAGWLRWGSTESPVLFVCTLGATANGLLFVLNMMPVPILDGWTVLAHWVPRMKWLPRDTAMHVSNIFLLAVFLTPLGGLIWAGGETLGGAFVRTGYAIFRLIPIG
jgi:Zn-dependent protease